MTAIYIIYHIIGRKVGCTKDPDWRHKLYEEMEGKVPDYEVLEELPLSVGDQFAGDREQWWRREFGYPPDIHYVGTMHALKARGRIGGNKTFELGIGIFGMDSESISAARSKANRNRSTETKLRVGRDAVRRMNEILKPEGRVEANRKGGTNRMAAMSSEERIAQARKAGKLGGAKGGVKGGSARLGTAGCQQKAKCPYCGIEGSLPTLKRWHFDYCKQNPERILPTVVQPNVVTCPYCGKIGGDNVMYHYHFDNCPHKPKISTLHFVRRAA